MGKNNLCRRVAVTPEKYQFDNAIFSSVDDMMQTTIYAYIAMIY